MADPATPWMIATNDRYIKLVTRVISLATGALVLPVLFLREFLGVSKTEPLAHYLNLWALISWGSLGVSILLGIIYSWLSVKWVKLAWGEQIKFFTQRGLEITMNLSFGLTMLLFLIGVCASVWFFVTFHAIA